MTKFGHVGRRLRHGVFAATCLALMIVSVGCGAEEPAKITTTSTIAIPATSPTTTSTTTASTTTTIEPPPVFYWPLTGLQAPDEASTRARVVSVKIENSSAARPQSNLDQADIVYETVTEGGITRFNGLYHSAAPDVVGPVRSARLSDLYIVPQYSALFAHVGGHKQVQTGIRSAGIEDIDQFYNSSPYWRSKERRSPHNMYASIAKLRAVAEARGFAVEKEIAGLEFDREAVASAPMVTKVIIPFSSGNTVEWDFDAESRTYLRMNSGRVHLDLVSGGQYRADNVVVIWARTEPQSYKDSAGSITYDIKLKGTGRASVFREGQRYDGVWDAASQAPPVFRAENGSPILLSPGRTWFQVVSTSTGISAE